MNFLDFKIRAFSPRELFYSLIGIYLLVSAIQGTISGILGLVGLPILIFGYVPYKFLPPERQMIDFLRFHLSNDSTSKRVKEEPASLLGFGDLYTFDTDEHDDVTAKTSGPECIAIKNLEEPYTITLKTNTNERFLPVSIYVDDTLVAVTSTNRRGDVSCTILIESYGTKQFLAKDEAGNVLYEKEVKFTP